MLEEKYCLCYNYTNMSRILRKSIKFNPNNLSIKVESDCVMISSFLNATKCIKVKKPDLIDVVVEDGSLLIRPYVEPCHAMYKKLTSLSASLMRIISSSLISILEDFSMTLKFSGVGYKVEKKMSDSMLLFFCGKSHPIMLCIPSDIDVSFPSQGFIMLKGIDKPKVTQFAALVRDVKRVEPYKGKGFSFDGEFIIRKEAKTGKK